MSWALVLSAGLLGLAGAPHCAVMCAAPCAALTRGSGRLVKSSSFHVARVLGYAVVGAALASSTQLIVSASASSPALRPLWAMLHAATFALGLFLLWTGRQPLWLEQLGRDAQRATIPTSERSANFGEAQKPVSLHGAGSITWQRMKAPAKAGLAGSLWVAWPCGLLQSALMTAALGNTALDGAAIMTAFAITSALGLVLGPALLLRWLPGAGNALGLQLAATRAAGALLAAASLWAMGHDAFHRVVAYCLS